jgi:protein-S-isoprenylcysteine O-methyltransferase Ste14
MSRLELKVPPVVVAGIVAALMWVVSVVTPPLPVPTALRIGVAAGSAIVAVVVGVWAIASFARAHTTVDPMAPERAQHLVDTGVYRFTRNPMYLGLLLILLAWAALLSTVQSLVVSSAFVLYMDRFQIGPEERALSALFGRDYADYTTRVRRWL